MESMSSMNPVSCNSQYGKNIKHHRLLELKLQTVSDSPLHSLPTSFHIRNYSTIGTLAFLYDDVVIISVPWTVCSIGPCLFSNLQERS